MSLYSTWGFNENDTTKVWDHSGNARHSTSATGLTIVTSDIGKAGRFDGSTTWIQYGNIADFGGTANLNINIKFKIAALTTTHYFLFKENHIKVYINNVTRLITWEIYKGGGWTSQSTVAEFLTSTWYKLGLSYDGVNMKMYINAVIDATLPTTGNLDASSSNLNIGSYNDGASNFFNGDIETFEIRNAALTADNILALNNFPNGMKIQTTKAHSFAAGDLLIQDYGGEDIQAIVTLNEDSKTFHVVPVSAKPLFNHTFIRVGNIKDTARQYFFEQNITSASPTITIRDGISTFALLTDASTKKIEINKSGITAPSLTLTTPLSPAYGGTGIANNAASTLTISGAFATTLTISGITSVTLPDSGTLYGTKANSITSAQLLSSVSDETGTGLLVFGTSPTFTTQITTPKILGGTGAAPLTYQVTSGAGGAGADHVFLVGNNGGTEAMRILNNGGISAGNASTQSLYFGSGVGYSTAIYNTVFGVNAFPLITTGDYNTAIGGRTLYSNASGVWNTAIGAHALYWNTSSYNTAIGMQSLFYNTIGSYNTAIGVRALFSSNNNFCTAIGYYALYNNAQNYATAIGYLSQYSNTSGADNISIGVESLYSNTTGSGNTAIAYRSLYSNVSGNNNLAIGYDALFSNTGDYNIGIGTLAGYYQTTANNQLFIDNRDRGSAANELTMSLIYGITSATVADQRLRFNAFVGINIAATANLHLPAGTATTPPLRLTSGTLTTGANILAGNIEFLTDKAYITITTGVAVKEFTLNDIALTAGRIPIVSTNGRLGDFATLLSNGTDLIVGATSHVASSIVSIQKNQNASTYLSVTNTTSGTAGSSAVYISNDNTLSNYLGLISLSAAFTTNGIYVADCAVLVSSKVGGLNMGASGNYQTSLWSNNLKRLIISNTGNVAVGNGTAALATTATDGFLHIPTCQGTPTGVPTNITGCVPLIFDTTNSKLYIYSGGAWIGGTVPGVFS